MKILSLDASTMTAGVAAMEDGRMLGEVTLHSTLTHSERLMVMVDQLLRNLETDLASFDAIAVSAGPGSFTGVRIGMATALGLARSRGLGLIAVSSLEGLAQNIADYPGTVVPIQDARRDQVYTAVFRQGQRVREDMAIPVETLIEILKEYEGPVLLVGPDAPAFAARIIEAVGDRVTLAAPQSLDSRAASIAAVAMGRAPADALKPNYVRKSQAERAYEAEHGESLL